MKAEIHPSYFSEATIKCSCGNVIITGATKEKLNIELCSSCHPFYTGTQKLIDTAKRVDKFEERRKKAAQIKAQLMQKKSKKVEEEKTEEKIEKTITKPKQKKTAPAGKKGVKKAAKK